MIDMHVHYFPPRVFEAIWRYFDSSDLWKVRYEVHTQELVKTLQAHGVERFTTLVYAHKAGMADYLNEFVREEAAANPCLIPFGTIFAGDGRVAERSAKLFDDFGFYGVKLHPFVSQEQIDDPRFFPLYETMQAKRRVLVCHPGSGPVYRATDGADRLRGVLAQFPELLTVVAHCGAFEYGDYHALAEEFEHVYFDTAMNCVHSEVFQHNCPGKQFFHHFEDRVLYGSDFPNIPYPYASQLESLKALELGATVERKLFSDNARGLLGMDEVGPRGGSDESP